MILWTIQPLNLYSKLPDKMDSVRRKSWERIFDKGDTDNDWYFVQATFWELRTEQVKSVRRFTGRGKEAYGVLRPACHAAGIGYNPQGT